MAKYTDAQCRLCRREGIKLYLKGARCFSPKCPIEKRGGQVPGQHGKRYTRRLSDFGLQLREKQKVKRLYSVLEKQFRRYYQLAAKSSSNTGLRLLQLLETRLDNVVYRLHLAPNRSQARQLISHGHVLVNGRKVDIPSYQVKPKDSVTVSSKAVNFNFVKDALDSQEKLISWVEKKGAVGRMIRLPERHEIDEGINERLIIEYYSR